MARVRYEDLKYTAIKIFCAIITDTARQWDNISLENYRKSAIEQAKLLLQEIEEQQEGVE